MMTYEEALEGMTPDFVLTSFAKNVSDEKIKSIRKFYLQNNKIKRGILNALLVYVLRMKKNQLPDMNYLKSVLETWEKFQVETVSDAVAMIAKRIEYEEDLAKQAKDVRKKYYYRGLKQKMMNEELEKHPWLKEYFDELDQMEG